MTTYLLPEWLGGAEVELLSSSNETYANVRVPTTTGAPQLITLDRCNLVEVKPAVAEPTTDGTVAVLRSIGSSPYAFTRSAKVRAEEMPDRPAEYRWWWHDNGEWVTWEYIVNLGEPEVLIPDPAADALAFPAELGTSGELLYVNRARGAGDALVLNGVSLSQNEIRKLYAICARALKPGAERDELLHRAAVKA